VGVPDRPINPLRSAHAGAVLVQARAELAGSGTAMAGYAARVLAADDRYGRHDGLVVAGDQVPWRVVNAVLELAVYGSLLHQRAVHRLAPDCHWCGQTQLMWHAALIDPLTGLRGLDATELHRRVREAVQRGE
jgi:hypothetical protein